MDQNPYQSPRATQDLPKASRWHSTWLARFCLLVMLGGGLLPFAIIVWENQRPDLAPYLTILVWIDGIAMVLVLATLWIISRRG